jgi:D-alanine-D-alanine ligase
MVGKPKVAVLMGGRSAEREISLLSGEQVFQALLAKVYPAVKIEVDENVAESLKKAKADVVFVALHGKFGEDGTVQGLLELLDIPYTGSGVLSSALALNKLFSKRLFLEQNVPTARFKDIHLSEWQKDQVAIVFGLTERFGWPVVIKPLAQGSSVGVSIAQSELEMRQGFEAAFAYDDVALVEEYIDGREIQVGVIGNKEPQPLPPIEIVSKKDFFDFEAKYTPGMAEEITPAPVSEKQTKLLQQWAVKAYQVLDCRGFARVDMFLRGENEVFVSEINTIPGLTANSLFPKEAQAAGIEFPDLIEKIVLLALEKD